jgi:general secretion pathway protein M
MKAWFQALAARERAIVAGGGGVLALVLVYLLVVEPLEQAFTARAQRVQTLEQQVEWMQEAAARVQARRDGGGDAPVDDSQPPYIAIDQALRGADLARPKRLEPVNDGGARLEFERVAFDPLMRVIARLRERHGLHATRARISRADADGKVAAAFTFERAGS